MNQKTRWLLCILLGLLLGLGVRLMTSTEDSFSTDVAINLTRDAIQDFAQISELSTYQVQYNGITTVYNEEEPDKIDYRVSYCAVVKAGIDFSNTTVSVSPENVLIVEMPPVEITEISVDIGSLDYLFENTNANTSTVSAQAYSACIQDVHDETLQETAILELAEENAKNMIKAFVEPLIASKMDDQYSILVRRDEEHD